MGRLCEVAHTTSHPPPFNFPISLTPIDRGVTWVREWTLAPLAMASDSDVGLICQRGAKRGNDVTDWGRGRGVPLPTVGKKLKFRVSRWSFSHIKCHY